MSRYKCSRLTKLNLLNKMILCFLFLVLLCTSRTLCSSEGDKCRKSSGLNQKDVKEMLKMSAKDLEKKMDKYKYYLTCMFEELALVDVAGNFDNAELMALYKDVKNLEKVIPACVKDHESERNLEDKIANVHLCILAEMEV